MMIDPNQGYEMSKKVVNAANEKDQKSILKYTEVEEDKCTMPSERSSDITTPKSTERFAELKDATPTQKRKRSQGNSPVNSDNNNQPSV